ncbi:hypothetical protein BDZ88DRAFT_338042 [Geranomyces variabilis]|nr:hypothetical protein BDZ88DRAFT_338042 [Geranomyces variabilis]
MTDLTSEFHRLLSSASRHNHHLSSHDSASPTIANQQTIFSKRTGHKEPTEPFLLESYRLLDHINQLHYFLTRAQKFYLNLSSRAGTHLSAERNDEARWLASWAASRDNNAQQPPLALLQMLPKLRDLTEPEREEMDSQVQRALGGLFSRTEVLAKAAEQPVVVVGPRVKTAGGLMTALFGDQETKRRERMLVEHRRSVVWLLRKRLMDTSNVQKHMQERLLRQRLQKEETFLYSASRTTPALPPKSASPSTPSLPFNISLSNITSSLSASFNPSTALSFASQAGLVKRPASSNSPLKSTTTTAGAADQQGAYPLHSRASSELLHQQHAEDVAARLTNRERMMLETANAEILESLEGSLDQVRRTTNALQEISSLHGRLAYEIQTQATAIDALYEEAWKTTDTVHRGNKQLVSAQRRFGTARLWVLIFLVVASAVLLFLDYYAQ